MYLAVGNYHVFQMTILWNATQPHSTIWHWQRPGEIGRRCDCYYFLVHESVAAQPLDIETAPVWWLHVANRVCLQLLRLLMYYYCSKFWVLLVISSEKNELIFLQKKFVLSQKCSADLTFCKQAPTFSRHGCKSVCWSQLINSLSLPWSGELLSFSWPGCELNDHKKCIVSSSRLLSDEQ